MILVILAIIAILGWTGLFILISWLLKHAFDIIDIIVWVVIGYVSLFVLTIVAVLIYHAIIELVDYIRSKQGKIKDEN